MPPQRKFSVTYIVFTLSVHILLCPVNYCFCMNLFIFGIQPYHRVEECVTYISSLTHQCIRSYGSFSTDVSTVIRLLPRWHFVLQTLFQFTIFVIECIQRNPATKSSSKKDVEEAVKKWLSGARDREGGRKKRTKQIEAGSDVEMNQQAEIDQSD